MLKQNPLFHMKPINALAYWAFLTLIVALPFRLGYVFLSASPLVGGVPSDFTAWAIFSFDILIVLTTALTIAGLHYGNRIFVKHETLLKGPILAFSVLILGQLALSSAQDSATWYYFIRWILIGCTTWLGYYHVKQNGDLLILKAFLAGGLIQSLIGLGQYIKQGSLGFKYLGESYLLPSLPGVAKIDLADEKLIRAYGTFGHPNQLAAFLLVACVTAFILLTRANDRKAKVFYGVSLFIIILTIFATFSRAGLLALPLMLGFLYLVKKGQRKQKNPALFIALISIFFAGIIFAAPLSTRLTLSDPPTIQRIDHNRRGLEIIKDHPIYGVGIGNILPAIEKRYTHEHSWQIQPPHNYFILLAAEMGLIGLALILLLFGILLKKLYLVVKQRGDSIDIFLLTSFGTFIFLMFFDHYFYTLPQTQILLWLIIGLSLGVIKKISTASGD